MFQNKQANTYKGIKVSITARKMTAKTKTLSNKKDTETTTLKLMVKTLNRVNSILPRTVTHDQFLNMVLDALDNEIPLTKEDIILMGVKNA